MMKKTFERNRAGKSTYKCEVCGKMTRDTGLGELGGGQCAYCWEEGGQENALSDGAINQEQFDAAIQDLTFSPGQEVWALVQIPSEARSESYAARVIRYHEGSDMYLCSIWDTARWFHPSELTPMDEEGD